MKKLSILAMGLLFVLTTACSVSGSGTLFDGKDSNKWKMTGDVSVQDDIMTLKGTDALAVLKNGKYKNFDLTLDLRTTPGGIGVSVRTIWGGRLDILHNRFAVYIYINLLSGYPDIHLEPLIFFYEAFGQIPHGNKTSCHFPPNLISPVIIDSDTISFLQGRVRMEPDGAFASRGST